MTIFKAFWTLQGKRKIKLFGEELNITPETNFPILRKQTIPRDSINWVLLEK